MHTLHPVEGENIDIVAKRAKNKVNVTEKGKHSGAKCYKMFFSDIFSVLIITQS